MTLSFITRGAQVKKSVIPTQGTFWTPSQRLGGFFFVLQYVVFWKFWRHFNCADFNCLISQILRHVFLAKALQDYVV